MARISSSELARLIMASPDYTQRWHDGLPATNSLYVAFTSGPSAGLVSDTLEAVDGSLIVLDRDSDGRVCGIEIS